MDSVTITATHTTPQLAHSDAAEAWLRDDLAALAALHEASETAPDGGAAFQRAFHALCRDHGFTPVAGARAFHDYLEATQLAEMVHAYHARVLGAGRPCREIA